VGATTLNKSHVRSKHRVCATLAARMRNSGHIKFLLEGPALDANPLSFSESNCAIPQIQGMRTSPQSLESAKIWSRNSQKGSAMAVPE
jgi:hypothetical protein